MSSAITLTAGGIFSPTRNLRFPLLQDFLFTGVDFGIPTYVYLSFLLFWLTLLDEDLSPIFLLR